MSLGVQSTNKYYNKLKTKIKNCHLKTYSDENKGKVVH